MLVGVSLRVGRGISVNWWGSLCVLVGVSLHIRGGVSAY